MLILAVDTSTRSGSLAVLRGEMPLAAVASHEQEPHSAGLFRSLSGVLGELRLDLHQIELFAVAAGPGVGDDNAVVRLTDLSDPRQLDLHSHR